ncbi:MAG: ComEA family DNA-binding protein [Thermoanaerobaculia bacterium]
MRKSLHILALTLVLLSVSAAAMAAEPAGAAAGVINVNTAEASQLALLPRVGEKVAQRIIEYRTEHGPFKKATDLMQVKGIGAKTFEGLSDYVAVEGKSTLSTKVKSPRKAAKKPATPASN